MRHILHLTLLTGAFSLILPALAADTDPKEEAKLRQKIVTAGKLTGKLTEVNLEGENKTLTISVHHQKQKAHPEMQAKYKVMYQQFQQAQLRRDEAAAKKLKEQLEELGPKTFEIEDSFHEFKLTIPASADLQTLVRRKEPPPKEPGEDGKVPPYTPAELKKLKGDSTLLGYPAALADLEVDAHVEVVLDRKAGNAKPDVLPVARLTIVPAPKEMALPGNPFLGK